MECVDGGGRRGHGAVEAEGEVRRGEVIADGLRNTHDLHAELREAHADVHRSAAAYEHQGVDFELLELGKHSLGHVDGLGASVRADRSVGEWVSPIGASKDAAALGKDASDI